MDFFEAREKYRRREAKGYVRWITRAFFIGLAILLGWQWGSSEQSQLQAERDIILYERVQRIENLNRDIDRLEHELQQINAEKEALSLTNNADDSKLTRLVKGLIARGTKIEQIYQKIQNLGRPQNCRLISSEYAAVATELYSGVESSITFFDGGLGLHVEGYPTAQGSKNDPWFDPARPVSARFVYLGSQKVIMDILPLQAIIPAEDWLLLVNISLSDLRGYVNVTIKNCAIR